MRHWKGQQLGKWLGKRLGKHSAHGVGKWSDEWLRQRVGTHWNAVWTRPLINNGPPNGAKTTLTGAPQDLHCSPQVWETVSKRRKSDKQKIGSLSHPPRRPRHATGITFAWRGASPWCLFTS